MTVLMSKIGVKTEMKTSLCSLRLQATNTKYKQAVSSKEEYLPNIVLIFPRAFLYLLILEQVWATYLGVCLTGIGGSFLWVGQGNYLVLNSEPPQHGLHVSLFWAIFTLS